MMFYDVPNHSQSSSTRLYLCNQRDYKHLDCWCLGWTVDGSKKNKPTDLKKECRRSSKRTSWQVDRKMETNDMCNTSYFRTPCESAAWAILHTDADSEAVRRTRVGPKALLFVLWVKKRLIYCASWPVTREPLMSPHPSFFHPGVNCSSVHFKCLASSPGPYALGHYANASSPSPADPTALWL